MSSNVKVFNKLKDIFKDKELYPFYDNEVLKRKLISLISEKFNFHLMRSKTFIAELYKEREWSKLYSLHYGTLFNEKINNKVLRIHLFSKVIKNFEEIKNNDESYLGYFTIRPIPAASGSISRARLKILPEQYGFSEEEKHILFINTKAHLLDKEFEYLSFPFIAQDNVVSVCTHADILMLSKYMFKKFNFNLIEIDTILNNIQTHNGRKIPSDGLVLEQILRVLENNRYNPSFYQANADEIIRFELNDKKLPKLDLFEVIDVALRSDLGVLMVVSSHIIVIGGYFYKRGEKYYIIYDDSSYYIKKLTGRKSFSEAIKESILREFLKKIYEEENEKTYLIIPTFDKFYLRYPSLMILLEVDIKDYILKNYEIDDELTYKATLIDNVVLKSKIKEISGISMPHYVWYVEWFEGKKKIGFSVIDATAHKNDVYYSQIIKFEEVD